MTGLVDTHCHLMDRAFDADRDAVLERARQAGVAAFILVGYDLVTSRLALQLAHQLPNARATVGIHPNAAGAASEQDFEAIEDLSKDPLVVGIGETGLDNYRDRTPPARQREALEWHLQLAQRRALPVIIHNRQADSQIAEALESHGGPPGVLHCFSSSDSTFARRMLDAGLFFSLAGPLTYPNNGALRELVKTLPHDRLLVETDCPYLPPQGRRGQRNEPAYLTEAARCLEQLTSVGVEQLWSNSVRVFPSLAGVAQGVA
jgi:TatD DNase family protein